MVWKGWSTRGQVLILPSVTSPVEGRIKVFNLASWSLPSTLVRGSRAEKMQRRWKILPAGAEGRRAYAVGLHWANGGQSYHILEPFETSQDENPDKWWNSPCR